MPFNENAQDLGGPGGKKGPIGDANPPATQDVQEGRAVIDYGTRPQQRTVSFVNLRTDVDNTLKVRYFEVQSELDEYLVAKEITINESGEEILSDKNFTLVKPEPFRKSAYDTDGEENDDGQIVTHISAGFRKIEFVSTGNITIYEKVSPAYKTSDRVYAMQASYSGVGSITLVVMNIEGRRWEPDVPEVKYFVIDEIDRDTFYCYEWDWKTNTALIPEDSSHTLVAKSPELRGLAWANKTIDGITYTTGDTSEDDSYVTRTASNGNSLQNETQDITPRWRSNTSGNDITIIQARYVPTGTGAVRSSEEAVWQDQNLGGHAFALRFA